MTPLILNLHNTSHTGRSAPGKGPPVPMRGGLGRLHMGSGVFGVEKRLSTVSVIGPQTLKHPPM